MLVAPLHEGACIVRGGTCAVKKEQTHMYTSRSWTAAQRAEAVRLRKMQKLPWHAPPHFPDGERIYLISGACLNHQPIMESTARRTGFEVTLIGGLMQQP